MILVLGGTAEARALAAALCADGWSVVTSLAGRVRDPALPVGAVRIGGFSTAELDGVAGLAGYLADEQVAAVVDATHPFAARISANAAAAARRTGTPLLRLERAGWRRRPDAARWTWVGSVEEAVEAGTEALRPFLTTGRQSLAAYLGWQDKAATVRVVDPPAFDLPPRWRVIHSRGPYAYADEHALMRDAQTDLLITKDSGGSHTAAKLDAARDLGIDVVMVARPAPPTGVERVTSVAGVLGRLASVAGDAGSPAPPVVVADQASESCQARCSDA